MATYDVLRLRVELLESLYVSSVDGRSDRGDTIFHGIPKIVVTSKVGHPAETLIIPAVDITKTPGG